MAFAYLAVANVMTVIMAMNVNIPMLVRQGMIVWVAVALILP
jgi:hypothetical protein